MKSKWFTMIMIYMVGLSLYAKDKQQAKPYLLKKLYVPKAEIQWGSTCSMPEGKGLLFGGSKNNEDGRPHTSILKNGVWVPVIEELRKNNRLQKYYVAIWEVRDQCKDITATIRRIFFKGLNSTEEKKMIDVLVKPAHESMLKEINKCLNDLKKFSGSEYEKGVVQNALQFLVASHKTLEKEFIVIDAELVKAWHEAQISIEKSAVLLDAEPPARALSPLVYDEKNRVYVLFGGDHFDYLTNDTWVFDPNRMKWEVKFPIHAPSPRANHTLEYVDGVIKLADGYEYYSNMSYCGGQYIDVEDNNWEYDVSKNKWVGGIKMGSPGSRIYREQQFHPNYYLGGEKPNAQKWEETLKNLPVNEWVLADPEFKPKLNRDWGFAALNPNEDLMLRWSGGHSAHGGTDVPHYHLSTNRWELTNPVEFPLDCLYSNTTYPDGFNFNLRPWITGHTYQNWNYDLVSKKMVFTPRSKLYFYDTLKGDWLKERSDVNSYTQYYGAFYTLTAISTPKKMFCWTGQGLMLGLDDKAKVFQKIEVNGDKLKNVAVDRSTFCFDSKRDRILMIVGSKDYNGTLQSFDINSNKVMNIVPKNAEAAKGIQSFDRGCYDEANDIFLIASSLHSFGPLSPTPVYDCKNNRWGMISIKYKTSKHWSGSTTRHFPTGHSAGVMFDSKRNMYWGIDANSQIYMLRLDLSRVAIQDLVLGEIEPEPKKK